MREWLALCDLRAPGWGSPGFRTVLCCSLSHLLYGDFVCDVSLLLCFVFSPYPICNAKPLSFATVLCGPMSLCNVFWPFWLLFCLFFGFWKAQQMWKHFPCKLPNLEGCKGATFSG